MKHRPFVLVVCVVTFFTGSIISSTYTSLHDNQHNWRAYLDLLTGSTSYVDSFRNSCQKTHDDFMEPRVSTKLASSNRDFGHVLDKCWPPAPSSPRHPTSAVTSLSFVFVASWANAPPTSLLLSIGLALLAGGSYRHHASGDASGRALDHAAVAVVAACIVASVSYQILDRQIPTTLNKILNALILPFLLLAVVASVASGNIEDNAFYVSLSALILGALLVWFNKTIAVNILIPICLGQYFTMIASEFDKESECTGDMQLARAYDKWHALWHVSVCAAASEALVLAKDPSNFPDQSWTKNAINPLSLGLFVAVPFILFLPLYPDVAAGSVFAVSVAWTLWQSFLSKTPTEYKNVSHNLI